MRRSAAPVGPITAGIILAVYVLIMAADLPGHLSYDSVIQLMEGRTGQYSNWHPAVMSWLLGLADTVVRGTALFVILNALAFFASLAGLIATQPRAHWAAAVLVVLWALTPQFLIYQGTVWKDVLFANASVAGFACLAVAAAFWERPRWRFGLIAGAVLLFALAALARQNGAVVALVGAMAVLAIALVRGDGWRRSALYGGGALVAMVVVALGGMAALNTRHVGDSGPSVQFQLLQTYDVIGAVVHDPSLPLDAVRDDDPDLEKTIRTVGVKAWSPERNDTLGQTPALQSALDNADPDIMSAQWKDLLLHHPGLYLRVRAQVFGWVFLTPDVKKCLPYEIGVDGPADVLSQLGLAEREDARDKVLDGFSKNFIGTPVLSHVFYAVLALIALYILARRRTPSDVAVGFLLVAAFGVTASFFVISIACDYRYLYFLDVSTMLATFYLALDPMSAWEALKRPLRT
ncbi:MAG TPA: hypothetical protein VGG48_09260 [Rhizomicrobium sp.]|jgi:hypothetical protein